MHGEDAGATLDLHDGDRLALVTKTSPGRIYRFDDLSPSKVNRPKFMGPLVDADRVSVVRLSPGAGSCC